jgi:hypothetical protein
MPACRQPGDDQEAQARQQRGRRREIAEGHQSLRIAGDETHFLQADQAKERAEAGADTEFPRHRQGVDQPASSTSAAEPMAAAMHVATNAAPWPMPAAARISGDHGDIRHGEVGGAAREDLRADRCAVVAKVERGEAGWAGSPLSASRPALLGY